MHIHTAFKRLLLDQQSSLIDGWSYTFDGGEHCFGPIRSIMYQNGHAIVTCGWLERVHNRGENDIDLEPTTIPLGEKVVYVFCKKTGVITYKLENSLWHAQLYPHWYRRDDVKSCIKSRFNADLSLHDESVQQEPLSHRIIV